MATGGQTICTEGSSRECEFPLCRMAFSACLSHCCCNLECAAINANVINMCLMQLFNVWVEPLVEVTVNLSDQKDSVVIEVQ